MEISFVRLDGRRYAIEVQRPGAPLMRMDPAPGFDDFFPHDLQHLIVEEQLGITDAIFGRLADGGTASTFHPVGGSGDDRSRSRQRRRVRQRNERLDAGGAPGFARSERATFVVWHDWLSHCPEAELQAKAAQMTTTASAIAERMDWRERDVLLAALPRVRLRVDAVARTWTSLTPGESLIITWSPLVPARSTRR